MGTVVIDTQIPQHVLSFGLEKEFFAVNVTKVIEIIEVPKISKIPKAPEYMSGVINVRNHMVPLVDTRVKLGMKPTEFSIDTCVIIVEINANDQRLAVGILVDEVLEVIDLVNDEVMPAPKFETNEYERFIVGMFSIEANYAMILNLDQIFSVNEVIALESITQMQMDKVTESPIVEKKSANKNQKKSTTKN